MGIGETLETLDKAGLEMFRKGHNVPGLRGLVVKCKNPQVIPDSEKIEGGIKSLTDVCQTCGAKKVTMYRVWHSGV